MDSFLYDIFAVHLCCKLELRKRANIELQEMKKWQGYKNLARHGRQNGGDTARRIHDMIYCIYRVVHMTYALYAYYYTHCTVYVHGAVKSNTRGRNARAYDVGTIIIQHLIRAISKNWDVTRLRVNRGVRPVGLQNWLFMRV